MQLNTGIPHSPTPTSLRSVAYSTFCAMWNTYVPYITVTKPRLHLCWQCMKNNNSIIRNRNFLEDFTTEVNKLVIKHFTFVIDSDYVQTYRRAVEHLELAKQEREYYKITCKTSAATLKTFYSANDIPLLTVVLYQLQTKERYTTHSIMLNK